MESSPSRWLQSAAAGAVLVFAAGCSTPSIEAARENFYRGRLPQAYSVLAKEEPAEEHIDYVLYMMERGMILHASGRWEDSSVDWIAASDRLTQLETYSVSKGAASLVVNDSVQPFRGAPYERTLLHAMTALNHFGVANWDDAAVEARRIIAASLIAEKEGYPADAFSYYVAGTALQMIDDPSNAALLYRKAAAAARSVRIDDATGWIEPRPPGATNDPPDKPVVRPPAPAGWTGELICFVMIGRSPSGYLAQSPGWSGQGAGHAEIRVGGAVVGRSYPLGDVAWLAMQTERRLAAVKAAKTAARVVLKEIIAESASKSAGNDAVGDLLRLLLIGFFESPDIRRWETLPRALHVARVPCPPNLDSFEVVFRFPSGAERRSIAVASPLAGRRSTWVSFVRDLPPPPPAPLPR